MKEGKRSDHKRGEHLNMRGRHINSPERLHRHPASPPRFRQMPGGRVAERTAEEKEYRYFVLWKPYGVATRNDDIINARPLASCVPVEGIYPIGFLDSQSEGVLLLTDNPRFRYGLNHARSQEMRIFLAQVELHEDEDIISEEALDLMAEGVTLSNEKTMPIEVDVIEDPRLPERSLPVRRNKPTCWLAITCTEGWSRHIRRITAAVGYPTLRLVQWAIGPVSLYEMTEGQLRELNQQEMRWVRGVLERTPMPLNSRERSSFRQKHPRPARQQQHSKRWAVKDSRQDWHRDEKRTQSTKHSPAADRHPQRHSESAKGKASRLPAVPPHKQRPAQPKASPGFAHDPNAGRRRSPSEHPHASKGRNQLHRGQAPNRRTPSGASRPRPHGSSPSLNRGQGKRPTRR
ncbi:hypothetical protein IJT17_00970 [bacterium]|nr:hypothetical protein [bacterium]